jgi:hypothetical protein
MINSYLEIEIEFSLGQQVNRNDHAYHNKMHQGVGRQFDGFSARYDRNQFTLRQPIKL